MDQHVPEVKRPAKPSRRTGCRNSGFEPGGELRLYFLPSFEDPLILLSRVRALSKSALRMFIGSAATPMMTPARQSRADASARTIPA
jgi:hypothetical protein